MKTTLIIGAGPSGMMAAYSAKVNHPNTHVILLERNERLGKKLRMTGGGRCNVTANVSNEAVISYVPKNGKFLFSSLTNFNPTHIQSFFPKYGCPLKIEDHNRVFPVSNKSHDIVDALERALREVGVEIKLNAMVTGVDTASQTVSLETESIHYDRLILATGSRTLPGTGSDGNGYELAKAFGHTITPLLPAEVPLVSNDQFIQEKTLQGLSFHDVTLSMVVKGKIKRSITHDLLIAHFGLSGPAALRLSFYIQTQLEKERPVNVEIDFCPTISVETLSQSDSIETLLQEAGIPKRLLSMIAEKTSNKNDFITMVKKFPVTVYDTRGFAHAFVTNGGVSLKEIDPKTMRSKMNEHVSMCGELMDYNAYTGGFNITSAFATGYTAGLFAYDV